MSPQPQTVKRFQYRAIDGDYYDQKDAPLMTVISILFSDLPDRLKLADSKSWRRLPGQR